MIKKKVIDAVLLSLSIAYAVTKMIENYEFGGKIDAIEEKWNNDNTDHQ